MRKSALRHHLLLATLLLSALSTNGCKPNQQTSAVVESRESRHLPVVLGTDLEAVVRRSERPLLVEFGVNFGCFRCDKMKPDMLRLAEQYKGRIDVLQVNFDANRQLASQLGATICPSYVLFDDTRVITSRSYPTSADLLTADIEKLLASQANP